MSREPAPGTLDHEYNTRLWARDFERTIERHREMGAAARAIPGARLAMPWGRRPRQGVDFFLPAQHRGPLLVFIHGGYWQYRASGKDAVRFLAPHFVQNRIAFAGVQYELCPDVTMDEMVDQLREALLWLLRNAAGLGYSIERLTVAGHSAGGHLAAMLALTDWENRGARGNLVEGACAISGLYDLRPLVHTYLNEALHMDESIAARNSPLDHLRRGAPPFLLAVGGRESGEFKRQTSEFADACKRVRIPVETFELAGRDHYEAVEDLIDPSQPLCKAMTELALGRT